MADRERQARLLADAKYAERQAERLRERLPALEARIKQALVAGDRDQAKRFALDFEQQKQDLAREERRAAEARQLYERARVQGEVLDARLREVSKLDALQKPMGAIATSFDVLERDADALRKIEEQAALDAARLEVALDAPGAEPPPPARTAEDILREIEEGR